VAQKLTRFVSNALTLSNIDRFSNIFHCQIQENICNNSVTKDPTTPQVCCYTTLWNVSVLKATIENGTTSVTIHNWLCTCVCILPLTSWSHWIQLGVWKSALSSPAWSGAKTQRKSHLLYFAIYNWLAVWVALFSIILPVDEMAVIKECKIVCVCRELSFVIQQVLKRYQNECEMAVKPAVLFSILSDKGSCSYIQLIIN